jgi:glycosyltransferase involved in cell wall biosynthesis
MNKIKVLEVIQQGEIGGGESHLLTLLSNLDTSKFEPFVVALSDGAMITRLNSMGIKNFVVKSRWPFNFFIWSKIRHILGSHNIDVVHTHGARSLSNTFSPAVSMSIPVVHTVHGWSFHDYLPAWQRRMRILGEKFLTRKADINILVSESNRKIGIQQLGNINCVVVNNGVDLSLFRRETNSLRNEFHIPGNAILVSFVARFIHDKNPLPLIRAFAKVKTQHPLCYLLMVGDGPARTEAIELVKELGLSESVILPGFRSDIAAILSASDIFCLPSIKEGLPVSLIEAMAMGNAVIATSVQGCTDVITDKVDGLLVDINNLEAELAKAITDLVNNPALMKRLVAAARNTVENRFDAVQMTRKIEAVYLDQVLKNSNTDKS